MEDLERELGLRDILKLASNENPLGPSPHAIKAILDAAPNVSIYPDGHAYLLRRALAEFHDIADESITLGNGSNDVLDLIARVFLTPEYSALISDHAFAMYRISTLAAGAHLQIAPARPMTDAMPYGHDLAAMKGLVTSRTRVIFIANPNNPTGTWVGSEELEAFIQSVPDDVIVVLDEAYAEYADQDDYPDAIRWIQRYPNLVVTRTFSKIHALAGLRVGYAISRPEIAGLLNRVRHPFNVNSLAQAAAIAALEDEAHVKNSQKINKIGLEQLRQACEHRALSYLPSVANFLCIDINRPALPVYKALLHEGVIVRPVANYGLGNFLRVTIGREKQNQCFLLALDKVLAL